MKKAICLLSGGLDSTTSLYAALKEGFLVTALTVHYGQLHAREIEFASATAQRLQIPHHVISFEMPWKGSALLDASMPIPQHREPSEMQGAIPATYVPARNSIFLTLAASCAEAIQAQAIYIGANALDYSGYPDCRLEFFEAFSQLIRLGTKAGIEGKKIDVCAPLLHLNKRDIVFLGRDLGVRFEQTWSCYRGEATPCGLCDSCVLRAKGFREAGVPDPLLELGLQEPGLS